MTINIRLSKREAVSSSDCCPPNPVDNPSTVQTKLLAWYRSHTRDLPWRKTKEPYRIWVSEVMLQQTRVETVIPYYERWIKVFPDIQSLASSNEEQVLKLWEGLGYYQRALNLYRAAREINHKKQTTLPESVVELKKLPGIGEYIAGAVASIAFGKKEPALDGNGIRVISRLVGFTGSVNPSKNKRHLRSILRDLLPAQCPGDFNQAVMDLGSLICVPEKPGCSACPLGSECVAYKNGWQNEIPVKDKRKQRPHYHVTAGVLLRDGRVLIDKRKKGGLLGGLWEFPGGKVEKGESMQEALHRELWEELGIEIEVIKKINEYKHAYTHFKVTVHTFLVKSEGNPKPLESEKIEWVRVSNLGDYPMSKVDRSISKDLQSIESGDLILYN